MGGGGGGGAGRSKESYTKGRKQRTPELTQY